VTRCVILRTENWSRVRDGTVPLSIVIYIDDSVVKHCIPVKSVYITVRDLNSAVSGKAMAWRVLGMLSSFEKSATPYESDEWRQKCSKHIVDSTNNICDRDIHLVCADGQIKLCIPVYSLVFIEFYRG